MFLEQLILQHKATAKLQGILYHSLQDLSINMILLSCLPLLLLRYGETCFFPVDLPNPGTIDVWPPGFSLRFDVAGA